MIDIQTSDPHHNIFVSTIATDFPGSIATNKDDLLDLITNEIFGTNAVRLGPKPKVEQQVTIREIITHYMKLGKPIPFMIPWGSEKPDGSGIDLAEFSALKMLKCLYSRVAAHYTPGLQFVIRLEDASAPHLFFWRADESRREAKLYVDGLCQLVRMLDLPFVTTRPESMLINEEAFNKEADNVLAVMEGYVNAVAAGASPSPTITTKLAELGWRGVLTKETADVYLSQYDKGYPDKNEAEKLHILARYFAGSLARYRLGIRGDLPAWEGKFLELAFTPAIRGVDAVFPRRVYYRTVPTSMTTNHVPAWRGKGFFKIAETGDGACIKLASFNYLPEELVKHQLKLCADGEELLVNADYTL